MDVPLRNAITPVTPPPAACGAQKTHSAEAATTKNAHAPAYAATSSRRARFAKKFTFATEKS